jgi:16S rRNA (guanine1207-N2)-methyltransferase
VDSNLRAVALADLNARSNGVTAFETAASSGVTGLQEGTFDVALANPPYFAHHTIARMFVQRSWALLKPGGRLLVVTKQPNEVAAMMAETFGAVEAEERRGYVVLIA